MSQNADTVTLPSHWGIYLVNGDASALDDGEAEAIDAYVARHLPAGARVIDMVEGSDRFTWSFALYGGNAQGGDVADFTILTPEPAPMVPQPVQQQQACAAPAWGQDTEGFTPRVVVGQTVHLRTRADWYAFASACRKVARDRMENRAAGESIFWANVGGRVFRCGVERLSIGAVVTAAGVQRKLSGSPVALQLAMIRLRPVGQRHAEELAWAARYRANAMRDRLNGHRKAMAIKALRACLADAAEIRTAGADAVVFNA